MPRHSTKAGQKRASGKSRARQTVGTKKTRESAPKTKLAPVKVGTTPLSKSDFIRSLPLTVPLRELLANAEALGLTISRPLVHAVRAEMKSGGTARGVKLHVGRASQSSSGSELEANLRSAAAAFIVAKGSERAQAVIADVSARILAAGRG